MINEINEYKAKQKGKVTPLYLVNILKEELKNENIEELVIIRKFKNGDIVTGWTSEDSVIILGMAEMLKLHILDELF